MAWTNVFEKTSPATLFFFFFFFFSKQIVCLLQLQIRPETSYICFNRELVQSPFAQLFVRKFSFICM